MPDSFDRRKPEEYASRVRRDYGHWFALIAVALYAWQLHGFWIGLLLLVGLIAVIAVTNMILLVRFGNFRALLINRWFWVAAAFVTVAMSGASIGSV